jgi:predicted neuraminidase
VLIKSNRMNRLNLLFTGALALLACSGCHSTDSSRLHSVKASASPGLVHSEFLFAEGPTPSCHASTIIETSKGFAAAWFGGTEESAADVGIWFSRSENGLWSRPVRVATGKLPDGSPCACWNPVLFQPRNGPLLLFYKVGSDEPLWWGEVMASSDEGQSWLPPRRLPDGFLGPIKNKAIQLPDGTIISPSSFEEYRRISRTQLADYWLSHLEISHDNGQSWSKVGPLADPLGANTIQPTILVHPSGRLQLLLRSQAGRIFQSWSGDSLRQWSPLVPTELPNPDAGIDAVTLRDGRFLLVYNHSERNRHRLNVATSNDGTKWDAVLELENEKGEFSYPAVIQSADGLVHVTYTWNRKRIKHATLDPAKFELCPIKSGRWPSLREERQAAALNQNTPK